VDLSDAGIDALLEGEPVARLATIDGAGHPHIVPIVFALVDGRIYSPIDGKPKRAGTLKRVRNIRDHPSAALLIDHYSDDWRQLWWLRLDVHVDAIVAATTPQIEFESAVAALARKYPQYATTPMLTNDATLLRMRVLRRLAWSAAGR
jgi:PPOX class probable F420-dependent enzyme